MTGVATCSVDECARMVAARGWCSLHYQRWQKTGDPGKTKWDLWQAPECRVDECERSAVAHAMCARHVARWRRHGDPEAGRRMDSVGPDEVRFASMFDRQSDDDCWLWDAGCITSGYGVFHLGGGERIYAHRRAYEQAHGPVPDGLVVDHTCHNVDPDCPGGVCQHRRCVNPAHLEPVTITENCRRGKERVRA